MSSAATTTASCSRTARVVHRLNDVENIEAWRAELRRQARADKMKVRTGFNGGIVVALRVRADRPEWQAEVRRFRELLLRTVPLGVELRHEPSIAVSDGAEVVVSCGRCSAVGYGDTFEDVAGGALFDDECPNEEPPALTALVMMHVPRSRWPSHSRGCRIDV